MYDTPPPPYSSTAPTARESTSAVARTFDAIEDRIDASKHSYQLALGRDTLSITVTCPSRDVTLVGEGKVQDSDLALRFSERGETRVAARARWQPGAQDFQIYVGPLPQPADPQWADVRYEHNGLTQPDSYHFTASDSKKLIWRQVRGHGLQFAKARHGWQLEDGADIGKPASKHKSPWATMLPSGGEAFITIAEGTKIAEYHPLSKTGQESGRGTLEWDDNHSEETEVAALVALIVILMKAH